MPILEYRVYDDLWVVSRPVFHEDSKSGLRFVSRLVEDYEFLFQTLGHPSRQNQYSAFYAIPISMGAQRTAKENQSNQIISWHMWNYLRLRFVAFAPFPFGTSFDADWDFEAFDAFEAVDACDVATFAF